MSDRKKQLLDIGVRLAAKHGVANVTRAAIAAEAGISAPAVGKHLGTTEERNKAIRKAMKAAGKSEPDKKSVEAKGKELRKKGPRKTKPVNAPQKKPAKPESKKPAAPKVQKPVVPTNAKNRAASPGTPKRAPRPKPTVVQPVPPSAVE